MKGGPVLDDKGLGVAPGQGASMRWGSGHVRGGLGKSVLVPNQQEGPSSSRITFQPSCLDINLSWGWGCGGGERTDRQADGKASVWTDSAWPCKLAQLLHTPSCRGKACPGRRLSRSAQHPPAPLPSPLLPPSALSNLRDIQSFL